MISARIKGVGAYIPKKRVSNDDLAKTLDTSDEWIKSHTGIRFRHISEGEETTSFMGAAAAKLALKDAGVKAEEIDQIILATFTPEYFGIPATACLIQEKIGAVNSGTMDLSAACSGFAYSLAVAQGLITAGTAKNILVIASERISRVTDWSDRSTACLFGDASGAVVVQAVEEENIGIRDSLLGAKGEGWDALIIKAGGTNFPVHEGPYTNEEKFITMDGQRVYKFAVDIMGKIFTQLMERNGLAIDDVDYIVPHQANIRILQAAAKRTRFPMDKIFVNIDEYANTSAATIPVALYDMNQKGLLKPGMNILTAGFGAGLTYGGNYIKW